MISIAFALSVFRLAIPMLFASLGGLFSERSGVINIALEGFMLVGAFAAAAITLTSGSASIGFMAAGVVGGAFALLYAFFVIHGRANQIVAGTAMNLLAMGSIPLLLKFLYGTTGSTPSLAMEQRFANFPLWFVWIVLLLVYLTMKYFNFGLWVSVAGENPEALEAAGLSHKKIRYLAVGLSGLLAAWGGASLSIYLASGYSRNMVAGRGFMALAALIFGKWRPLPTAFACLFFGLMEAIQFRVQSAQLPIAPQFVQMIPYLATILVLSGLVGRSRAPKALGQLLTK